MPRKFERTAVFLVLVASPFWLPSIPPRFGASSRLSISEWMSPVFQTAGTLQQGFGHLFSGLLEWMSVYEENQVLRAHLQALRAHEGTHQQLLQENGRLRRLLEFKQRSGWSLTSAEVIGRELGPWSRSLLLDKGSRQGIREGMAVITPTGLLGRVSDVGPSSSRVMLLADPHFRVTAVLLEGRLAGLVSGGGTGECLLTYLPLSAEPREGEAVQTAGGKSFCPDGIPIGVIRKVWIDRSQLYKTAGLQPAVDPGAVEEVLIVAWHPSGSGPSS